MHKHLLRIAATFIAFTTMLPLAAAQGGIVVTGIELQAAPNAMGIRWQAPTGAVDRYKVYFSKESILENNGRYLGAEETIGNQTSMALLDLANRGFSAGDTAYVTITAIDATGMEYRAFGEEKSAAVIVTQGLPSANVSHNAANLAVENAVAENESAIRLVFTAPVAALEGHPATHFAIAGEDGSAVSVLSAEIIGNALLLQTTPMVVRTRYTITTLGTVKGADGSSIDPANNSATFVARPSGEEENGATLPTPLPTTTTAPVPTPESMPLPLPTPTPLPVTEPVPTPDTTPPEDAQKLTLQRIVQNDGNYTVKAEWGGSKNTAKDLAAYHLYESPDRGYSFVGPTVLLGTVMSSTIANIPPGTFTLKVTAVDQTGNESKGVMETIILPQTGAATLFLSGLGAAAIAARRTRKRVRVRREQDRLRNT